MKICLDRAELVVEIFSGYLKDGGKVPGEVAADQRDGCRWDCKVHEEYGWLNSFGPAVHPNRGSLRKIWEAKGII